jgi:histidine triad (HIT) family protein
MSGMEDTIFDKIIRREVPADVVYEDESVIAFLDIKPNNPGHTLVVPKNWSRNIFDMEDANLCTLITRVKKIAHAVKEALNADGVNIAMNNEPAAGQIVFHAHIHVIPRFIGDNREHKTYAPGEAAAIAAKIRAALT